MIICSCNGISDMDVRNCATNVSCHHNVADIYSALGHRPNCGVCARTIRDILRDLNDHAHDESSCSVCPVRAQIDAAKARVGRNAPPVYDFLNIKQ